MPITLPTTTTTTQDSASPPPPTSSPSTRGGDLSLSLSPSAHIKARILRPLDDLASTRGKLAAAVVVCRALYNLVHFVLAALSRRQHALLTVVYHVVDQLVVMYSVGVIVEAEGERRVLGWRVGRGHFDGLLGFLAVVHVLYAVFLIVCIVSYAIFFGVTGGAFMMVVGLAILPVAWVASRPEDGEGSLSLP